MSIFDTAADAASSVADVVKDTASSAVDAAVDVAKKALEPIGLQGLPDDVTRFIGSLVTGPLKDFANTDVGRAVLRAFATSQYYYLAPILGPQLAAIAFAFPGLAQGKEPVKAWVDEFVYRVRTTGAMISSGQTSQPPTLQAAYNKQKSDAMAGGVPDPSLLLASNQLTKAVKWASAVLGAGIDPRLEDTAQWADLLKVREDVLVTAIRLVMGDSEYKKGNPVRQDGALAPL